MISIVLRCSNRASSRRILAAASASVETLLKPLSSPSNGEAIVRPITSTFTSGSWRAREFHCKPGPLNFRASIVPRAEIAIDDYSPAYEEEKVNKDEGLEVAKLSISQEIVSALSRRGITTLFPIQRAVLEPAMQGRDMIGRARTGTGKTLAFGIPIMDKIIQFNAKHGRGRNPLCLVLAPTRELAKQVEKEFHESAPSLDTICVYGGTPISQQMRQLDYGVDIAVGTPGRIIDLLKRGALNLSEVQFLVIDEADQMLQVGFAEDVETILQNLPQNRQSMMFSATMPAWIKSLTQKYLKNPLTIDLVGDSSQKLAEGISLFSIESDMYGKASVVGTLVTEHAKGGKCIVFTQTKRDADRLAYAMSSKYRCEALHGDISQSQRERTLSGFRDGHFNILVATDVAARGLDIPSVDLIIHYELPNTSETFVHRTGRTGRAGKKGTAILIYTQDQIRNVRLIEREVGCRFSQLPRIAIDSGSKDFVDMGLSGRFGGPALRDRRLGDTGGRFGGRSDSGFGRGGNRGSSFGSPSANANRYGGFGTGRGGSGDSDSGRNAGFGQNSGFGGFGSGRLTGFRRTDSHQAGRFGDSSSNQSSYGQNSGFGGLGSGRFAGFGGTDNRQAGRFDDSSSNQRSESYGDFGSRGPLRNQ